MFKNGKGIDKFNNMNISEKFYGYNFQSFNLQSAASHVSQHIKPNIPSP